MAYLPNNLEVLKSKLQTERDTLERAKKRYEHFIKVQKSELLDKFVTVPIADAYSSGKSKKEIELIEQNGNKRFIFEFEKAKTKKYRELKIKDIKRNIKNIKQLMLEINPNSLDDESGKKIKPVTNAQARFELSF